MGIHIAVRHHTKYTYDRAIKLWPQVLRLRPAPHSRTKILGYSLNIQPELHFINWMQDPFGNYQARIVFPDLVKEFVIDVEVIADMVAINPFDFFLEESAEIFPFTYSELLKKELQPYLEIMESGPLLQHCFDYCRQFENKTTVDFLVAINHYIFDQVNYTIRMEVGVQACEETLEKKLGSCRDSAWLLVQLFRHFGLAARFVSGYLVQLESDIKVLDGPSGPEKDFTDLHAWAEVFVPGAGWIGLDATSGLMAGEGHIPLACTPHYASAAPITGSTEIAQVAFEFKNEVERIYESPRVTKPYSPTQLIQIYQLGQNVDHILEEKDARLTMGGEPTFISNSDMETKQWNSEADGKDKRKMAFQLSLLLKEQFGQGGFIHFGQGKWYPGEPVPRWQYAMYWRKNQQVLWEHKHLLGNSTEKGNLTREDAANFISTLAQNLGLSADFVIPAYEDKYYYLWEEHNLPVNFDQEKSDESLKIERRTLLDLLKNQGLSNPTGYVLPMRRNVLQRTWQSCHWLLAREHLFLIPGNSQMGLRLPLDRLDMSNNTLDDIIVPANHFEEVSDLLDRQNARTDIAARAKQPSKKASSSVFQTALCAQIQHGNLHLFLPPMVEMNHFLDLLYTIEYTAEALGIPVILEGYQPPFHEAVVKLVVAPDPGVVEVNIHPAASWNEITQNYEVLFQAAEMSGLGTNKFMLDGKHTGTGGGNHITLGGKTPADSPFLRRPDVLRSMINFWQNHPGLSYLFSSQFIGPTSQAPRVDEGRPDILYELEIAFSELEKHQNPPFWFVDRVFRNLLTDITGNTHRAEFCIDKLYSPDSSTGRLGILEMRGFDMPPHKDMCLVQLLLIRALFAAFWKTPYKKTLIHWGTELHNKFMMHHYVKEDMHEVVDYLNRGGIEFDKSWLDVFLEFRFPLYGSVNVEGINLTLRAGIEPWIVLGEEMSSSGTARYVDSSVERLEVLVEDFNPDRYLVLCNSIQVPVVKTRYKGKYVASVRYKAWAPYSALHPTIGVNSPLIFDIYDTWNERAIGGCTYHVVHPGGRNYETFPVNSLEAESRRVTRFWEFNHSPRQHAVIVDQNIDPSLQKSYLTFHNDKKENIVVRQIPLSKDFPHTLDLRRG
ncbi:MAG TPA: transglutaminase family protein [Saprospiraceae bacterium]|nr:transglutaminase family protein [Saprospiraceae bacterium]HMQ81664.1 transglutaminase family protein [Saprospiraceae bacterium]